MKLRYERETLINLLAVVARTDKTAPPCWRMNEVLGAVERLVMVQYEDCAGFAEIVEAAREAAAVADPATLSILRLARINGLRRITTPPDTELVLELFRREKDNIANLESGPRKDRCVSFWKYQKSVFTAALGLYGEAARDMATDAEDAAMPTDKRAIARWSALVYANLAAIVANDAGEIARTVAAMEAGLPDLARDMAGSDMEVQWVHGNAPGHLLLAAMLTGSAVSDYHRRVYLSDMTDHADALGQAFTGSIAVFKAEQERLTFSRLEETHDMALAIADDTNVGAPVKALAHLVMARANRNLGHLGAARAAYETIKPEADCHAIAAVAARELALLPAE